MGMVEEEAKTKGMVENFNLIWFFFLHQRRFFSYDLLKGSRCNYGEAEGACCGYFCYEIMKRKRKSWSDRGECIALHFQCSNYDSIAELGEILFCTPLLFNADRAGI